MNIITNIRPVCYKCTHTGSHSVRCSQNASEPAGPPAGPDRPTGPSSVCRGAGVWRVGGST